MNATLGLGSGAFFVAELKTIRSGSDQGRRAYGEKGGAEQE